MKSASVAEKNLNETFLLYKDLVQVGEYYGAALRLAMIFNCLPHLEDNLRRRWISRVRAERLPEKIIKALEVEINERSRRIMRIVSVGTKWNEDEILFVLLARDGIELLRSFLNKNYSRRIELSLEEIDKRIEHLADSPKNKRSFQLAVNQIQKNSQLPVASDWLTAMMQRR